MAARRALRVTMHSTTVEACGVADYTRDLIAGLDGSVGVEVVPIEGAGASPLAALSMARRLSAADLTHIQHNYGFWGRGSLGYRVVLETLQRAISVPIVLTAHSVRPPLPRQWDGTVKRAVIKALGLHEFMDRGTFRFAARIIVHSRRHLQRLVERGIPRARLVELMPGVPDVTIPPGSAVATLQSTWDLEGKRVLGLFGFIQPNKNYELAVRALAHLPEDVVLLIAGGVRTAGEEWYGAKLRELIRSLGMERRVRITGFLPAQARAVALGAVDLFVLPYAADDSVSYSARLCLAHAKPLLASAVDSFAELQERYRCVELFATDDPAELAAQIGSLLADEARRQGLVDGARRYGRERSWRRVAAETIDVYGAAVGRTACESSS